MNSAYPMVSSLRQIEWTVLVLFTGLLTAVFRKYPFMVFWAYGMLLAGFLMVGVGIVVYWNLVPDPKDYDWVTMMPHFTNIRHFGYYAAAATILSSLGAAWITHQVKETGWQYLHFILLLIQTMTFGFLFWSGGRGSIVAVGTGLLWLLFFGAERKRRWLFALLTALSGWAGFVLASFFVVENIFMGFLNSYGRTVGASTLDRLLSGRVTIWKIALQSLMPPKGNLLFGYGPDAFSMRPHIPNNIIQPHNVFIQALLEWGVPGTILFSLLLLLTYTSCWNQARKITNNLAESKHHFFIIGSQSLWISFFFLGLIDGVFYHALPLTILGVCAAIIFASNPPAEQAF